MLLAVNHASARACTETYPSLEAGAVATAQNDEASPTMDIQLLPGLPAPLADLSAALNSTFQKERQRLGRPIDLTQPKDSWMRLDSSVRELMQQYAMSASQDFQKFVLYNPHHYVRHLLDATDDYELILICWKQGQVSRIHNHASSHCWLTCLSGAVEERQYSLPVGQQKSPRDSFAAASCPDIQLTKVSTLKQDGSVGYINDFMCLHSVGCDESVSGPGAVTLHLYAPPVRRVKLYEPAANRVTSRVPGFFTVRGKRINANSNASSSLPAPTGGDLPLFDGAGI